MNSTLWQKIENFQFDDINDEFGFTTRLAKENYWSINFTKKAVLEYKKFMFLASISSEMVSPSPIVDEVWHLHIIYTKSYSEFCNLLGKNIQHVPSTHSKSEALKFSNAKDYTLKIYEENFGKTPNDIWSYKGMYESLNLEKSHIKLRTKIINGILFGLLLLVPFLFLLRPIYIKIDNPNFLVYYALIFVLMLIALFNYNKIEYNNVFKKFDKSSFIFELDFSEILFLKKENNTDFLTSLINKLIIDEKIIVNSDKKLSLKKDSSSDDVFEQQIINEFMNDESFDLKDTYTRISLKPKFSNIPNFIFALSKYLEKSKFFNKIFLFNFGILCFYILLGLSRILIGISRGKPIGIILPMMMLIIFLSIVFLKYVKEFFTTKNLLNYYSNHIISKNQNLKNNVHWQYFLLGSSILIASFAIIFEDFNRQKTTYFGDTGGSCGSSCGSSCGGCGGD